MCGARAKLPCIAVPLLAMYNAFGCRAAGQHLVLGVSRKVVGGAFWWPVRSIGLNWVLSRVL